MVFQLQKIVLAYLEAANSFMRLQSTWIEYWSIHRLGWQFSINSLEKKLRRDKTWVEK